MNNEMYYGIYISFLRQNMGIKHEPRRSMILQPDCPAVEHCSAAAPVELCPFGMKRFPDHDTLDGCQHCAGGPADCAHASQLGGV